MICIYIYIHVHIYIYTHIHVRAYDIYAGIDSLRLHAVQFIVLRQMRVKHRKERQSSAAVAEALLRPPAL